MKNKIIFLICTIVFSIQSAPAQIYEKLADDTIGYVKAGTFGKPDVIKKTSKIGVAQVRVHYKFVTTQAAETRNTGARVSVYLDGAMTNGDLQNLTDEFYRALQKKLGALGIEFVDWSQIQNTEYYADRQARSDEKRTTNGDAKSGQGWLSFTANDGPVFMRYAVHERLPEPIAYSKAKNLSKTAEAIGADLMTLDVVLDFTSISLATGIDTSWVDGTKYLNYQADYRIAPIMSVPESYALFYTQKNKFDIYNSKLPIVTRDYFSGKPFEDASKAALRTRTFFGEPRFTFTPVVIEADRNLYIAAARNALNAYADLFVEKMRLLRGGTVSNNPINQTPSDNTTMKQVTEEARKNNDTTPVTTNELTAAIAQAEKQGKFQLAADYYGELIKLNPDDAQNYLNRGIVFMNNLKNYKAAANDFSKAIEMKINNPVALYNRGSAYVLLNDWKKAIKDLDAFIAVQPNYAEAYLNRGIALLNTKKTDEAIADFNRGIQIAPRLPNLYRARAVAYQVKGNTTMAQADELKAAQIERGQ